MKRFFAILYVLYWYDAMMVDKTKVFTVDAFFPTLPHSQPHFPLVVG